MEHGRQAESLHYLSGVLDVKDYPRGIERGLRLELLIFEHLVPGGRGANHN